MEKCVGKAAGFGTNAPGPQELGDKQGLQQYQENGNDAA
jgi:hypothetical protein